MKLSQKEIILQLLENDPEGIHSFTLVRDYWILRASERIRELKEQGHTIISTPEKMGNAYGVRYTLQNN